MSFESTASLSGKREVEAIHKPGPVNDIHDAMDRAATLCSRVSTLADHLVGSAPEADGAAEAPPNLDGLFNAMSDHARYVARRLADAERALERIEKVVL